MTIDYEAYNHTIRDYTTHALVKWLHSDTPRKDKSYHNAPRDIYPLDGSGFTTDHAMKYAEGIAIASTLATILCILTFLFFFLRCCFRLCRKCCCKVPERKPPNDKLEKTILIMFICSTVFVVGGVIYGFIANQQVTQGVRDVLNVILDIKTQKDDQVHSAREIVSGLEGISLQTQELEGFLQDLSNATGGLPGNIISSVDDIITEFSSSISKINSGVNKYDEVEVTKFNAQVKQYDHYRWIAQLAVLLLLLFPFILTVVAVLLKSTKVSWNVLWVGVLSSCLGWLLTGLETSVILFMSDACFAPTQTILHAANDTSHQMVPYVEFFVICRDIPNPLQNELDSVTTAVDSSQSSMDALSGYVLTLETYANVTFTQFAEANRTMNNITASTRLVVTGVNDLLDTVFKCNRLHNNYVDSLDGICHSALEGYFALVVIQGGIAFMTLIAIYFAIRVYRKLSLPSEADGFPTAKANASFNDGLEMA